MHAYVNIHPSSPQKLEEKNKNNLPLYSWCEPEKEEKQMTKKKEKWERKRK